MLMALLYCEHDRIAAAALACDQTPYGPRYWEEIHPAEVESESIMEVAYVFVEDPSLREKLLTVGIDGKTDRGELAGAIEKLMTRKTAADRAA